NSFRVFVLSWRPDSLTLLSGPAKSHATGVKRLSQRLPRLNKPGTMEDRMDRARFALALLVVSAAVFGSSSVFPQTTAPPEGWVILPVDDSRARGERATPTPPPPAAPPVDVTLTRIDYDLRVDADSVVGRALLTIDVLREGWTRLGIPTGLMVRE